VFGAGNDGLERAHHLATVADAECEGVLAVEEGGEFVAAAVVHQDGPRPAEAGAEHVAVGEAAAGDQALEVLEADAAGQNVAHMDVDRSKAGLVEGRSHFVMAVDALLAQDGDARRR
jgi:hypothetical protein